MAGAGLRAAFVTAAGRRHLLAGDVLGPSPLAPSQQHRA